MSNLTPDERRDLLEQFLDRWPEEKARQMTLGEYVDVNNKDTFTYWVETKMRPLGSIKGSYSIKFGIYRRENPGKRSKRFSNDSSYTWMKRFGGDPVTAFEKIKQQLLQVIRLAQTGEFSKIDEIQIPDLFKWKVASLYSNERVIPIFKHDVLLAIADDLGMKPTQTTKISEIQDVLINSKPAGQDIYSYMDGLYRQYGPKEKEKKISTPRAKPRASRRKATTSKSTTPEVRKSARSYIADLKHNRIQQGLRQKLITDHGEDAVVMEENWVDIKLVSATELVFYEVKSASYASDCIEEALGQVLGYVFRDLDERKKRIVVVGQFPPNADDERFIAFLQSNVNVEFSYEHIDISET
jgi:hypothetical protein